ncbi:MAG: hypothetical protein U0794_05650 [Isosphaeraceae bacterium]
MRYGATALALLVFSGLTPAIRPEPHSSDSSELIADSVREFSGKQGAHGWSYGYWDRASDADASYNQTTDFQLLKHFGSDPKNRLSRHPQFTTGDLWNLQDGLYYTSLWAEGGHPNSSVKLGAYPPAEQWAVRRWVSTWEGTVTIRGFAGKVMPWGKNWSGSCRALIVVDGKTVFSGVMDESGTSYAIDATVHKGSLVDFLIGPNPNIGVTKFTASIRSRAPLP